MLTIFTFSNHPAKYISKDNVIKLMKHFNCTAEDPIIYSNCCRIQYNRYCYYIHSNIYTSFTVTMETDAYIIGDLYVAFGNIYQLVYHKNNNKWCRLKHGREFVNSTAEEILFNQIKGVLYVMEYRRMMINIYYLLHNIDIISDIHTHINTIMLDTFIKNMFVII
jgi:hypothetical protein